MVNFDENTCFGQCDSAAAEKNGRSLNPEIVVRLEGSFGPDLNEVLKTLLDEQTEILRAEFWRDNDG